MMVVVDSKMKEIRASLCSLLIEKLKTVYEVGGAKLKKKSANQKIATNQNRYKIEKVEGLPW